MKLIVLGIYCSAIMSCIPEMSGDVLFEENQAEKDDYLGNLFHYGKEYPFEGTLIDDGVVCDVGAHDILPNEPEVRLVRFASLAWQPPVNAIAASGDEPIAFFVRAGVPAVLGPVYGAVGRIDLADDPEIVCSGTNMQDQLYVVATQSVQRGRELEFTSQEARSQMLSEWEYELTLSNDVSGPEPLDVFRAFFESEQ